MYLLYDLLLLIAAIFLVPYYLLRGYQYGKSRRGIRERLGHLSAEQLECFRGQKIIWVHAVSVGETRAAGPLLERLRQDFPDYL
ncbi:MAG: 3-deoxy-D-manno-octulosonic acid transferase, partial [Deltaproteobacteria bacterium]|nr:3-deoxy-D-manno-octulosonic acid transferase [Deltaproteobacteria bacterium]